MWKYSKEIDIPLVLNQERPSIIFKHSNRCSLSDIALQRMLSAEHEINKHFDFHLIDVIVDRSLSQHIANELEVHHESPQAIVIHNGEVVLAESHLAIRPDEVIESLNYK